MRVSSVNVNGIRAAMRKGMAAWIAERRPDVLLLQEVRADATIVADLLGEAWNVVAEPSQLKGRAGVAVAVAAAHEPVAVRRGLPGDGSAVDSGRWLEVDLDIGMPEPVTFVSAYLHSGTAKTPSMDLKYAHLDLVEARLGELRRRSGTTGHEVLVAGDFNVVRGPADLKNWSANHNRVAGVLDPEMAYLHRWFTGGWADVHRQVAGDVQGPYTWWSMRGRAFDNDAGWRIDYQIATPGLAGYAERSVVDRAPSWEDRFSDHAPLTIDYALPG